jgi:hypothetical protein
MASKVQNNNYGIGVVGLLGVAFVVLKLTGYIDWSWWLVTLPFWGGFVLLVIVLLIVAVMVIRK